MLTGTLDLLLMYYAVDVFEFDAYLWKLISNIAVIVLNYLAGRFVVFMKVCADLNVQLK